MIHTGGGVFDPTARPIYFAAGVAGWSVPATHDDAYPKHVLVATNELMGEDREKEWLIPHFRAGKVVLLDSGIFWLTNQYMKSSGGTMDQALSLPPEDIPGFKELFDRYVQLAKRYEADLWGYIELDQGGMANKRRTRARLHDLDLNPMPVYHPFNDGWEYFDELALEYDRMCLGNVVQAAPSVRLRLLHTMWERHAAYPDLWVHVLGLSAGQNCLAIPVDSCDSSTWTSPFQFIGAPTETAMLKSLGHMGPEWHYSTNTEPGRLIHSIAYAEGMTHMNRVWHDVTDQLESFGVRPYVPQGKAQLGQPQ